MTNNPSDNQAKHNGKPAMKAICGNVLIDKKGKEHICIREPGHYGWHNAKSMRIWPNEDKKAKKKEEKKTEQSKSQPPPVLAPAASAVPCGNEIGGGIHTYSYSRKVCTLNRGHGGEHSDGSCKWEDAEKRAKERDIPIWLAEKGILEEIQWDFEQKLKEHKKSEKWASYYHSQLPPRSFRKRSKSIM